MNPDIITELDKMPSRNYTQDMLLQSYTTIKNQANAQGRPITLDDISSAIPFFNPSDSKKFLDDILHIEKLLWKEPSESE